MWHTYGNILATKFFLQEEFSNHLETLNLPVIAIILLVTIQLIANLKLHDKESFRWSNGFTNELQLLKIKTTNLPFVWATNIK